MNRFLRRYSKWILAVFGTLLMVVFLVPQAIDAAAQRAASGGAMWAEVDGERVPDEELRRTAREVSIFDRFGGINAGLAGQVSDEAHWFLLSREAEQAGFTPSRGSDAMSPQQMIDTFTALGGRNEITERATARVRGVDNLMQVFATSTHLSDRRAIGLMRELLHEVDVRMIVLDAATDADRMPTPSSADVQAHFEQYRDEVPGSGEFGFGYRLPDRFSLEVLTISAASIRAMIETSAGIDGTRLFEHWYENRNDPALPAFDETAASIPDEVREHLIDSLVAGTADEIRTVVNARLLDPRRGLDTDDAAYLVLPDDWASRRTSLESIADAVEETFAGLDRPVYDRTAGLIDFNELAAREDLRRPFTDRYGPVYRVSDLVRMHRAFDGSQKLPLQAGVAGPILDDGDGGVLVFRVLEADPSRPPRDLAEAGDAPARDLRRRARYDQLLSSIGDLESTARNEGMFALAIREGAQVHDAPRVGRFNGSLLRFQLQQGFAPQESPADLPVLGPHRETVIRIVEAALERGATTPPDDLPADQRVFAIEVPDRLAIAIVELVRQGPLDDTNARTLIATPGLMNVLLAADLEEVDPAAYAEVFTEAALRKRHAFTELDRNDDPVDGSTADDDAPEAAETAPASSD